MIDRLIVDVGSALRSLRAAPAIPAAVILTTALAVGINLAMVGLIDRALLSAPPHIVDPERVFTTAFEVTAPSGEKGLVAVTSFPAFEAIHSAVPDSTPSAWHHFETSVSVENQRVPVKATAVTGGYFGMLGVRARIGRTLLPDDDRLPAGSLVAVVSHSLWRRAFGSDEHVMGRRLTLGGLELEVVGVMPAGFAGHSAERTDLWLPLRTAMHDRPGWDRTTTMAVVEIGGRLAAGQNAGSIASRLGAATGARAVLAPLIGADVAPAPHRIAFWLAGVSMVVLLAGLANGATLSLVGSARRRRETSIKVSLGATRGRLARQLLIEAAIVAGIATGVALVCGYWLDEIVRRLLFPSLIESTGMTRRVLIAAGIGGACTLLVAVTAGVLQVPRQVAAADLLGARRSWRRTAAQRELLIVQTTLAVLLMTGSGMFAQNYYRMATAGRDARLENVLVASFEHGPTSVLPSDQDDLLTSAVDRVRMLPGVAAATPFFVLPFHGVMAPPISIPGRGEPRLDGELPFLIESTPELLEILGIEIVQGRRFTSADDRGAPVAIVSETMARAMWPAVSALGKCIRVDFDPAFDAATAKGPPLPPASAPCREIVGIARDLKEPSDRTAGAKRTMHYYLPFAQRLSMPSWMAAGPRVSGLVIQPESGVDVSAETIRRAIAGRRVDLPFVQVRPYATLTGPGLAHWLIGTKLLLLFGALALTTAAVGIHAAFAHSVARRRHEIAVRLAIGASRHDVRLMVLREGAGVAASGILYGTIVAALAGWAARSTIAGLTSPGPLVMGSTGFLVMIAAMLATWVPAASASRAEPHELLRAE
jgi:predicted permease